MSYKFCRAAHFENIIEAYFFKRREDVIDIVNIRELPVKRRRRHRDFPFVFFNVRKRVIYRFFCVVRANPDALAAVYAALFYDHRFSFAHSDRFRRTAFHAVDAAFAFFRIQRNRMKIAYHLYNRSFPREPHGFVYESPTLLAGKQKSESGV